MRDLRVRWALEEAGLPYRVESTPFANRQAGHFAHQPFGQAPWLTDGELSICESGAILLHVGELSEALMPAEPRPRSDTKQWLFAALNSVEMASLPWSLLMFSGESEETAVWKLFDESLKVHRLPHLETVLAGRKAYVTRAEARPSFVKATPTRWRTSKRETLPGGEPWSGPRPIDARQRNHSHNQKS